MDNSGKSNHLFQKTLYKINSSVWCNDFSKVVKSVDKLTLDTASILGILSLTYCCGSRTLFTEIERQPWLSCVDGLNVDLCSIPSHGLLWDSYDNIADHLKKLLYEEACSVAEGKDDIYILLSGGLDSRIVAGIFSEAYKRGDIVRKPIAITWGFENCRDVVYGEKVAEMLGFEWQFIPMTAQQLEYNTDVLCSRIGCLVSPIHLHAMGALREVSANSLVLAGSYGDSVGRAEFSGKHLLELDLIKIYDYFDILTNDACSFGYKVIIEDLEKFRTRVNDDRKYVVAECEKQGHYMRNMIATAMESINQFCNTYQMFTDPKVYSYMWSIHPSLRNDKIYGKLLESFSNGLLSLPWARTNKSLSGPTLGAQKGLLRNYHDRVGWISKDLYEKYYDYLSPEWFADTGIFKCESIKELARIVRDENSFSIYGIRPFEQWLWLASLKKMCENLQAEGVAVVSDIERGNNYSLPQKYCYSDKDNVLRKIIFKNEKLYDLGLAYRGWKKNKRVEKIFKDALIEYPPQKKK